MSEYRVYAHPDGPVLEVRATEDAEWEAADPYVTYSELRDLRAQRDRLATHLERIAADADRAAKGWGPSW